ncbi:MAG: Dabb family protein [Clostridia bacterium]|nr:Dabb family protein [Clostridia bacterium]
MVKHVILWTLKEEINDKDAVKIAAKEALEALVEKIDGLVSLKVNIEPMASSNVDMMLDSEFVSQEALCSYAKHPEHVAVADTYVRPYTATRSCMDYEI